LIADCKYTSDMTSDRQWWSEQCSVSNSGHTYWTTCLWGFGPLL